MKPLSDGCPHTLLEHPLTEIMHVDFTCERCAGTVRVDWSAHAGLSTVEFHDLVGWAHNAETVLKLSVEETDARLALMF